LEERSYSENWLATGGYSVRATIAEKRGLRNLCTNEMLPRMSHEPATA